MHFLFLSAFYIKGEGLVKVGVWGRCPQLYPFSVETILRRWFNPFFLASLGPFTGSTDQSKNSFILIANALLLLNQSSHFLSFLFHEIFDTTSEAIKCHKSHFLKRCTSFDAYKGTTSYGRFDFSGVCLEVGRFHFCTGERNPISHIVPFPISLYGNFNCRRPGKIIVVRQEF